VKDHSGNVWRRKPTDMYVVEITTDKSFETLTAEDAVSDGSYNQVSIHWMVVRASTFQGKIFDVFSSHSQTIDWRSKCVLYKR
jgi:hypothetical protein